MDEHDLLPCPFCGEGVSLVYHPNGVLCAVMCESLACVICPETGWFTEPERPIADWNRRVPPPAPSASPKPPRRYEPDPVGTRRPR